MIAGSEKYYEEKQQGEGMNYEKVFFSYRWASKVFSEDVTFDQNLDEMT